ncbi:formylglycine-generating enzyme family protein [Spirulina sp. 06S082]|uniref:formylglycine-generating enzyme family protein n=1 Tax=Spirulina sp. 06S082 TaxID=3110248 RepID=UPI002B1FA238|nr:formylglycine-generating enzyme family protein [Spirulina sp. 06S082]MEA5471828.1 formylglycine-generating enzyme family protein [Spirulina sp. 06S082]
MNEQEIKNYLYELFTEEIFESLKKEFTILISSDEDTNPNPILIHRATNLEFSYIPSGEFIMGFSEQEENFAKNIYDPIPANLDEMRPVHRVKIKSFLISRYPILCGFASQFCDLDDQENISPFFPAFLTRAEAEYLENETKLRLPYEEEWEYCCRAGTKTLFIFGNNLIEEKILEKWLAFDFSDVTQLIPNPFGLYGMFVGEWCKDEYRLNYNHNAQIKKGNYVIRGGGAIFWPWQDQEWVWCMSAMRMSSENLLEDGRCGLRLVYELDNSCS